jgi:hypothetical protein
MKKPETAADKLKKKVDETLREMRNPHTFDLADIASAKVSVSQLRAALDEHGVLVINDAFTSEAFEAARSALREAFRVDIEPNLPKNKRPPGIMWPHIISTNPDYWKTGLVGNKSFGFLFLQPEKKDETAKLNFGDDLEAAVAPCSAYNANLTLMTHPTSQIALATLMAVSGTTTGMISQDSVKMHRGVLTKPHVDIYSTQEAKLDRVQAMAIGPREGKVRLCFARGSHTPEIQRWIADVVDKPDFYKRTGFLGIPDEHRDTILKTLMPSFVVGAPNQLVLWRSGVVHVEMQQKADGSLCFRNDKKTTTERYVVGTHKPYQLTQRQLLNIGYAAKEHGFIFHPYYGEKGSVASINTVCHKSTQYKKPRTILQGEKDRLAAAQAGIIAADTTTRWGLTQNPRLLHCLGVTQDSQSLFDDEIALKIFTNQ